MKPEERQFLREAIAIEKDIRLYREYTEEEPATFLRMHPRTLAQKRREGQIACIRKGARNIGYFGQHVVDYIIRCMTEWDDIQNGNIKSETTTSQRDNSPAWYRTCYNPQKDESSVSALARQILKKPSKS